MAARLPERTLLGLSDGELDCRRYRSSYLTNKVGGVPDWPPAVPRSQPRCRGCGAPSALVVQVYCPLEASPYHRTLHLFACPAARCSGGPQGWTLLRSQSLEEPRGPQPDREAPLAATDWCQAAEDWGEEGEQWGGGGGSHLGQGGAAARDLTGASPTAVQTDVSSRLQALSLGGAQQEALSLGGAQQEALSLGGAQEALSLGGAQEALSLGGAQDGPVLRPFFISVVEEEELSGEEEELRHAEQLLREYEQREGAVGGLQAGGGAEGGGGEQYEKARARHGDAVFSSFRKRISRCPQQILRYCRGGDPLFISEPPPSLRQLVPACGACGGARTFELQLMPALVSLLQGGGGAGGAELEFGTVLLFTCSSSCWGGAALEEFCFLQADPDHLLFS